MKKLILALLFAMAASLGAFAQTTPASPVPSPKGEV